MTVEAMGSGRPAPEGFRLPFVGSLPGLVAMGTLPFLQREWERHGDVYRLQLGPREAVMLVHPDGIERVLGSHRENYIKAKSYDGIRLLTGDGLLTLEGDAWRSRRRLENPAFHRESVHRFVATMVAIQQEALAALRWRLPNGGIVDIHHEMLRVTLEIVAATLFGQRLGEDSGDASGKAFAEALSLLSERGNSPVQLPLEVPTPGNRRIKRAIETLDQEVLSIIAKARATPEREDMPTLLKMLLGARDADTGKALTDRELRNEVITLLAGHETTALLMTWGLLLLAQHPAVVTKIRAELQEVLGDREPTAQDISKLVYLRQVIDEILRLRPPAWSTARDAVRADVLCGKQVKAGDLVIPVIYLTHRHPDFWSQPERFDPDRFAPEKVRQRHHWAYLPFSLGPRICIGQVFSLTEGAVLFASLLRALDFEAIAPEQVKLEASITLRPGGDVPLRLRWRQRTTGAD